MASKTSKPVAQAPEPASTNTVPALTREQFVEALKWDIMKNPTAEIVGLVNAAHIRLWRDDAMRLIEIGAKDHIDRAWQAHAENTANV